MKRSIVSLLLIGSLTALCACSAANETAGDKERGEQTQVVEESTAPVETTVATQTPTPSPSPAPTNSPTPTPIPKPEVKIEDAYHKVYNIYDRPTVYRFPRVLISGVDTSKVNKTLKDDLGDRLVYDPDMGEYYGDIVDYEYYVADNVVSIMATLSETDIDYYEHKVYNVSIATGQLIDDKQIVAEYGISDDEFFSTVKKIYKKFNAGIIITGNDYEDDSLIKEYNKKNLKLVSYKHIKPYFSSEGHLCFLGYVYFVGGADEGYCRFDATDVKVLGWE